MFLPLFSGKMVGITLKSIQIHRKKPLCANFEVTFVTLVYAVNDQFGQIRASLGRSNDFQACPSRSCITLVYPFMNHQNEKSLYLISNNEL